MTAKKNSPKGAAGRGRPRAFDTDKAVETAMALFHDRGYEGVSVAELGAAIGVNPPSLYAAFGSKKGLFERALKRYVATTGGITAATLAEPGPVAEVVPRVLTRLAEVYATPGGLRGCLVLDSTRNCADPEVRALTEAVRLENRELLRRRIAEEYPEVAEALADYIGVTLAGLSAAARDGMTRKALRRTAAMAAAAFIAQLPDRA
ncbi:MAG TPA: TetR/AcrR family transcriptional regulator [Kiloniellaceae bacterium]